MIEVRRQALADYPDVFTAATIEALGALGVFESDRRDVMARRLVRRSDRAANRRPIEFLDPGATIPRTSLTVQAAREGQFDGSEIPADLQRQWIQGTGPGAKPSAPLIKSLRNVAYALLSGADGWMFDGEDALGQLGTMSLDNQRNLRLAIHHDPQFLSVAEDVAMEMNRWADGFFGRPIIADWQRQLGFTTRIFRARGLHLDDRHVRAADGSGFSASIVDLVLYVVANHRRLIESGSSIVLYLPKIQTAEEAALWNDIISRLESHLGLTHGAIKTYVLVEQLEAVFQLMEIRAALGGHFVGFNTGRWDYINSVSDAMAWDPSFINPNIDVITMTYPYMQAYEDRVRRAVNTPDRSGRFALWQGGMEPNIPVGSADGVRRAMERAVAGAKRAQQAGASGKWVAHWKMVHIVRPVWEAVGEINQAGRRFPPLTHIAADAQALTHTEDVTRSIRGARDLISVAMQYANAFGQGMQAAALKPADSFGDDDVLYLMEDMATAEIRVSILWEWLHKRASLASPDRAEETAVPFTAELFERLLAEEYGKLVAASNRDVHDDSKRTTLPIARLLVDACVTSPGKLPWFVDMLNATLGIHDMTEAQARIESLRETFLTHGVRVTANLDFDRDGVSAASH